MTRIITPTSSPPASGDKDLFRFGWRHVRQTQPDGTETVEQVPLTLEDLLHPQWGDVIVQNSAHDRDCRYLGDVLQTRLAAVPGALVLVDCQVDWDDPDLRYHSPDISVIFDVKRQRPVWSTFNVTAEGVRPKLIIEVASADSRVNDVVTKVDHYHRAGVPLYAIVDRKKDEGPPRLVGYRHTPGGYDELPLDDQGRLLLEPVGLRLGLRGNRAVLYDAATGEEQGDYEAVTRALQAEVEARAAAEARAEAEAQARAAAEARLRELEAELRRLRNGQ